MPKRRSWGWPLLGLTALPAAIGCQSGVAVDAGNVHTRNSVANVLTREADGRVSAAFHGVTPTFVTATREGIEILGDGPYRTAVFTLADGTTLIVSDPTDWEFDSVEYDAESKSLKIEGLRTRASSVIRAKNDQVADALSATESLSRD